MTTIRLKENEPFEVAMRRFKRTIEKTGLLTELRARDYLATRPYYVYQLQLMARRGGPIRAWADLKSPKPGGGLVWSKP